MLLPRFYDFFSQSPFQVTFPCYILQFQCYSYHTRVGWILGTPFCPIQHLPEPSNSSCKVAWSLFRYHLHINVATELVERHLMWRQQLLKTFVVSLNLPLVQRPTPSCDVTLKKVQDDMTLLLTSDPCSRDGSSPQTCVRLISYNLYFSLYTIPLITSFGHPRIS